MTKPDVDEKAKCFESIFSVASQGIVFVDQNGIILRVNPAFTKILGYENHELLGKPFYILNYKNQKVLEMVSHGPLHRFCLSENASTEMILFDKEGHDVPVRFRSIFIRDKHDQIKEVIGMIEHMVELTGTAKAANSLAEKMWEAQQNFDNVLENSADAIIICDISGNIMMANKAFSQMLSYTQEEVKEKHITEFTAYEGTFTTTTGDEIIIDEEYMNSAASITVGLFEKGYISNWEAYLVRKDKVNVLCEITMSVLRDKNGESRGSVVIARDITERKSAEKERKQDENKLRETNEYLDNLIESSLDGIIVSDSGGNVRRVNKSFLELIGFEEEALIGKHIMELSVIKEGTYESTTGDLVELGEKFFNDSMEMSVKLFEEGKVSHWESYYHRKDGKIVPVEMEISHICNEKEDDIGSVGICRDITERRKAEKELIKAKEFLESVIENSIDGILITDYNGQILSANTAIEKQSGYNNGELVGEHAIIFSDNDEEENKRVLEKLMSMYETGSCFYESKFKTKDGKILEVECSCSLIKDNTDNIVGAVSIIRDITDRKKMELRLLQSEKLKSLGELAGGVAHDFNNVLAAILGRAQLLKIIFEPPPGKTERRKSIIELKKGLETIERASLDGAETVRRIQEFARRRDDDRYFTSVDMNVIIDDALEFTKLQWKDGAESKGITIHIKQELSTLPSVAGSAAELREVLTNLINNAIFAMPQGGTITFKTFKKGSYACIKVQDTGMGIPEAIRNKIFDPFFTTKGPQSSGLGMSVSYGIIERHRGTISVDSVEGKETTFIIEIPFSEETVEGGKVVPISSGQKKVTILIVEDEEDVRNLLKDILTYEGHRVETASNGNLGIEKFKKNNFDMVLTDLGMPGMSGWQVAEKIKAINGRVPIALITGWSIDLKESEMKAKGIDFIIRKPYTLDQLVNVVQEGMILREIFEAG